MTPGALSFVVIAKRCTLMAVTVSCRQDHERSGFIFIRELAKSELGSEQCYGISFYERDMIWFPGKEET